MALGGQTGAVPDSSPFSGTPRTRLVDFTSGISKCIFVNHRYHNGSRISKWVYKIKKKISNVANPGPGMLFWTLDPKYKFFPDLGFRIRLIGTYFWELSKNFFGLNIPKFFVNWLIGILYFTGTW
jgi:hypothetical protein